MHTEDLFRPDGDDAVVLSVHAQPGAGRTQVVGRHGDSVYLHAWDDYERFTVKVTGNATSGIGRTWLRASSPEP